MIKQPSKLKIKTELRTIKQNIKKEFDKVDSFLKEAEQTKYRGNPLLKRAGDKRKYTKEEIQEFVKCKNDIVYFVENYMKIVHVDDGLIPLKLYDYQRRILRALQENRFNIILQCRQSGKCCFPDTKIKIKNSLLNYNNGLELEITIEQFYSWIILRKEIDEWLEEYNLE